MFFRQWGDTHAQSLQTTHEQINKVATTIHDSQEVPWLSYNLAGSFSTEQLVSLETSAAEFAVLFDLSSFKFKCVTDGCGFTGLCRCR